ncbi:UPF0182 family membrane protein [Natronincola ferrireducens]|uniref:UPF0182 protein SAMN05660472_03027 n=1 Tax=Natronincola ferrireducens TaxID=393762 RepID=A0A1G9J854_9FIRM|nr:UPF0182 family protein [Natronincola ferrireducens]SDL33375.1 hypothetical protein SAMN05660472_03027 [Natronincola ferrireducens]
MNKRKKILIASVSVAFFVFVMFFTEIINFIADYQWFSELGYEEVFLTKLKTQLTLGVPVFIVATILYYVYLIVLKKDYYKKTQVYEVGLSEKRINKILIIPSVVLGFITASSTAGRLWFNLLNYFHAEEFAITDPIFQKDISFYIFKLPVLEQLLSALIGLLVSLVLVTFIFYVIMFVIKQPTYYTSEEETKWNKSFIKGFTELGIKQLTVIGILFFIIIAANHYLAAYNLLYSTTGAVYGAGYTDIHVTLILYRVQMVIALLSSVALIYGYFKRAWKKAFVVPAMLIVVTVLGNFVAIGVEKLMVDPNVIAKETPYIANNINYTRKAYGLGDVTIRDFDVNNTLTAEDLQNNEETINNIRINDYRPTIESYNQLQAIRPYYQFLDVDIDRYMINGEYTQVFLAPRELDQTRLSDNAKTWINQHLKYTHGYGVALSPVNAVTSQGQPELLIRNIPPVSTVDITIERPEIYFGELTNNYIVINTKEKEFDYPLGGESSAETTYEGTAGIPLAGFNRLLYTLQERSLKLLISNSITSESKIIRHRNVLDRVNKIAPFIHYDDDPYIVIKEGKLYWIIDGYTITGNYPYATPYMGGRNNYIRNSVKVVVDAYNGDTNYYISDEEDPVIKTYSNIFPQLFKSMEEMPEGLKNHIRYPQVLFDIQAEVYETYHVTNPTMFYAGEEVYNIAKEKYAGGEQEIESQYMIMKLPGKAKEEFVLSVPYTPNRMPNMTAILMARNDTENYGELILYRLPKDENIYGPMQIENRIDGDSQISQNLTLWGEGGSQVIRGNLLVIPIEDSILYVEPLYIRAATQNSLPEVKKVIVAYRDQVVMEKTLDLALERIFGKSTSSPSPSQEEGEEETETPEKPTQPPVDAGIEDTVESLIQKANEAFENANRSLREGNWGEYGRYIQELEEVLKQLENYTEN